MGSESLIIWLIIGGVAGWLAGLIMKGYGFGIVGNVVVGILGSMIGGWLFGTYYVGANGVLGAIFGATLGAVILLFAIRLVQRNA